MKNTIIYIVALFFSALTVAQNANDGITIGAHIPDQAEDIPASARKVILNKMAQIITKNGISDQSNNARFIMTPQVTVMTKNITPTAPPKVALSLDLTLYLGDGVAGNLFTSESFELKGVGNNETKAYMNALNRLKSGNAQVQSFLDRGRSKIIAYYNQNCDLMLKKATLLESQNKADEALATLVTIPEASDCFESAFSKINKLFQTAIDQDCSKKLARANAIWAANQDIDAANEVGALLSTVDPQSACFNDIKRLYSKVAARVKDLQDRDWNYKLKELDLERTAIRAARDVGVAYGNGQPNTVTYTTRGWF